MAIIYEDLEAVKKDVAMHIRAIRRQGKKVGATKKSAHAFLVRAGICKKSGGLTARYR